METALGGQRLMYGVMSGARVGTQLYWAVLTLGMMTFASMDTYHYRTALTLGMMTFARVGP